MKPDSQLPGQANHAVYDRLHATLGVPGAQGKIRVVHETVEGRRHRGFGPQEEHRKLQDLPEPFVPESLADDIVNGGNELGQLQDSVFGHQFNGTEARAINEIPDGYVVVLLRTVHETVELDRRTCLYRFEGLPDPGQGIVYIHKVALTEIDPVCGPQAFQFVIVRGGTIKIFKKALENIRHPIPGGAHVELEPVPAELSCAPSKLLVLFINVNLIT